MINLFGKGVSVGIGKGPLHFIKHNIEEKYSADTSEEQERFDNAVKKTVEQLQHITEIYNDNDAISQILNVHSMLTEDASFMNRIYSILEENECNAEYAVYQASRQISSEIENLPDSYISERKSDIEDVASRIISNLTERNDMLELIDHSAIIVVDELLPTSILDFDREKISGVICKKGSYNSHSAILLRSLNIPAVFNIEGNLSDYYEGLYACIDGEKGCISILPDEKTKDEYEIREQAECILNDKIKDQKSESDVLPDGRSLPVLCNVNLMPDVSKGLRFGASGIGLIRTELLFLGYNDVPSEQQQYEIYEDIISRFNNKKVVIRTLDITSEKKSVLFHNLSISGSRENDSGIRFCLNRPELFLSQLRAIYRASVSGNASILLPGVTDVSEIIKTKILCKKILEELYAEMGNRINNIPIGIMIETKEALEKLEELSDEADFFSIGTNDLSIALVNPKMSRNDSYVLSDKEKQLVVDSIRTITEVAKRKSIPVSICGEMASDEKMIPVFLDIGIDEISVSASEIQKIRHLIHSL